MSLFNIRSLFSPRVYLLTIIVFVVITAVVASSDDASYWGPSYRIIDDRNRLEGMTARLEGRLRHDVSKRVYPDIKTNQVSAERSLGGHGQGPRVTAILDRLRKEYETRLSGTTGNIISSRLQDFSLLENAAELTGPTSLAMVDEPLPRFE